MHIDHNELSLDDIINYLDKKKVPLLYDLAGESDDLSNISNNEITPDRYTEAREASYKLAEEIDNLPVIYGTILSLFHLEDMRYSEIAEIMQLPDGTVKNYLYRARKMLKNRF